MFIKVRGSLSFSKAPNQSSTFLVNIHQIIHIRLYENQGKEDYKIAINTVDDVLYTDDDVADLIQKRMATPYNEPFLEKEKEYREPILPQDINCLAEFSDDHITWCEGSLVAYSESFETNRWGGRFVGGTAYYKHARIPV